MKIVFLAMIRFYQRWLSPLWGKPACRFLPTCSEYAREAIQVHGPWRGGAQAAGRLLRCHPFCQGGFDPVLPVLTPGETPEGTTR